MKSDTLPPITEAVFKQHLLGRKLHHEFAETDAVLMSRLREINLQTARARTYGFVTPQHDPSATKEVLKLLYNLFSCGWSAAINQNAVLDHGETPMRYAHIVVLIH